mmetsp:Transcript_5046/g.7854  ORF Transcript_5046/g.7854 Transcript_5046/m.7854 type:complete len:86 (-) Transcript_5046:349-606(-)
MVEQKLCEPLRISCTVHVRKMACNCKASTSLPLASRNRSQDETQSPPFTLELQEVAMAQTPAKISAKQDFAGALVPVRIAFASIH